MLTGMLTALHHGAVFSPTVTRVVDPDPEQARSWLRRELARPEYHDESWLQKITDWVRDSLDRVINATASMSPVATAAAVIAVFLVLVAVVLLVARVRRGRVTTGLPGAALPEQRIGADQHRAVAEAALRAGDTVTAALEAFRAQAMRLVEEGQLSDSPGATATELARQMGLVRPDLATDVRRGALLFDATCYGDHVPSRDSVTALLEIDHRLQGARR